MKENKLSDKCKTIRHDDGHLEIVKRLISIELTIEESKELFRLASFDEIGANAPLFQRVNIVKQRIMQYITTHKQPIKGMQVRVGICLIVDDEIWSQACIELMMEKQMFDWMPYDQYVKMHNIVEKEGLNDDRDENSDF